MPLQLANVLPTFNECDSLPTLVDRLEAPAARALADGVRGGDLGGTDGTRVIGTAVVERL